MKSGHLTRMLMAAALALVAVAVASRIPALRKFVFNTQA